MDKILVADDLEDVRDIIVMMIEAELDVEVLEASDGQEAIEILQQNPDICVIISDYDMPNKTGGDVYQYCLQNLNKPFILISSLDVIDDEKLDNFEKKSENSKISKPFEHEVFTKLVAKSISQSKHMSNDSEEISEESLLQSQVTGYFRNKLQSHMKFIADTYIKIGESKFIKIGEQNSIVTKEQIDRFLEKGIDFFYLNKDQFNDFLNSSIKNLMDELDNNDLGTDEVISLHLNSIKQVQEVVKTVGVKQPVIELTDKVAGSVNKALSKEKNLKSFLKNLVHKENYFFEHSNIINYLCGAMVKELGWDKERATKRFITVSMFFDISLNDPKLAVIQNITDSEYSAITKDEQKEILNHIKKSIEIVSKSKSIIGDEFKIIEQHHEKPDGSGFPKGLNASQIPPQSAVFIIAHEFAYQLIRAGGPDKLSSSKILDKMGRTYGDGNFEKPYNALKKALSI